MIPYRNAPALLAYYLAVFSLIPVIGLFPGIPAVVLGVLGLRKRNREPIVKGAAHAWVGIILGGLTTLLWGGIVVTFIIGILTSR